mmetsp:Transcript_10006/g.28225  ORF Transcript_10006/g.28225 Transcript_10006/m.28225 type:complete len:285 (-) Transcript_10006:545-1399(-)
MRRHTTPVTLHAPESGADLSKAERVRPLRAGSWRRGIQGRDRSRRSGSSGPLRRRCSPGLRATEGRRCRTRRRSRAPPGRLCRPRQAGCRMPWCRDFPPCCRCHRQCPSGLGHRRRRSQRHRRQRLKSHHLWTGCCHLGRESWRYGHHRKCGCRHRRKSRRRGHHWKGCCRHRRKSRHCHHQCLRNLRRHCHRRMSHHRRLGAERLFRMSHHRHLGAQSTSVDCCHLGQMSCHRHRHRHCHRHRHRHRHRWKRSQRWRFHWQWAHLRVAERILQPEHLDLRLLL